MMSINDCPNTVPGSESQCHCLIRHAITPDERARATLALNTARAAGDSLGITVALYALTACPSQNPTDQVATDHQVLCHSDGSVHEDGCDRQPDPKLLKVYQSTP